MTDTATVWLAIIALSVLVQTALLAGAAILVHRRVNDVERRLHVLERDSLVPLLAKIELALSDLQDALARVRRADDDMRRAWGRTKAAADGLLQRVGSQAWPVWGVVKGVRAAANALARAGRTPRARTSRAEVVRVKWNGEPLFAEEGGHVDVRS